MCLHQNCFGVGMLGVGSRSLLMGISGNAKQGGFVSIGMHCVALAVAKLNPTDVHIM